MAQTQAAIHEEIPLILPPHTGRALFCAATQHLSVHPLRRHVLLALGFILLMNKFVPGPWIGDCRRRCHPSVVVRWFGPDHPPSRRPAFTSSVGRQVVPLRDDSVHCLRSPLYAASSAPFLRPQRPVPEDLPRSPAGAWLHALPRPSRIWPGHAAGAGRRTQLHPDGRLRAFPTINARCCSAQA